MGLNWPWFSRPTETPWHAKPAITKPAASMFKCKRANLGCPELCRLQQERLQFFAATDMASTDKHLWDR